jgi:TPR repeat protein
MTLLTRFRATYAVGCLGLFGFLLPVMFFGPTATLDGPPALAVALWSLAVAGFGGMALAYFTRCPQCGLSLLRSSKRWDRAGVKGLMISCAGCGYDLRNAEAMRRSRNAAYQGDADAQYNLGVLYRYGRGVAQDYAEAMRWYKKAADQGNADAQNNIGMLYMQGLGVAQDYAEAMRWYRKAADQGEATAQNNIGVLYQNGWGVAQDYGEAMRWYRKVAEQGDATAQYNLGVVYERGLGAPVDLNEARIWMQKAAEGGDDDAKQWLASH